MHQLIVKFIEMYKRPSKSFLVGASIAIAILLMFSWLLVYVTGGTMYVYLHISYIPITLAAFLFKERGGIIVGIIAGVLIGPLMPLDVENSIDQTFSGFIFRTVIFVLVGGIIGMLSRGLKSHILKIQETLDDISIVYSNTLKNYARMVSTRDEQTAYHCERVAYNALLIGEVLKLREDEMEALYWAGLLHDVGKIGVKEETLLKPGKLTEGEFNEIKRHTVIGDELITSLSHDLDKVAEGVRSHHEKWDGSGYPDGLKGEEIPLFGRIISVVDVFEALTSERPYKKAWEPDEALNYIIENKGIQFDTDLVEHFERLYREGRVWISTNSNPLEMHVNPLKITKNFSVS